MATPLSREIKSIPYDPISIEYRYRPNRRVASTAKPFIFPYVSPNPPPSLLVISIAIESPTLAHPPRCLFAPAWMIGRFGASVVRAVRSGQNSCWGALPDISGAVSMGAFFDCFLMGRLSPFFF